MYETSNKHNSLTPWPEKSPNSMELHSEFVLLPISSFDSNQFLLHIISCCVPRELTLKRASLRFESSMATNNNVFDAVKQMLFVRVTHTGTCLDRCASGTRYASGQRAEYKYPFAVCFDIECVRRRYCLLFFSSSAVEWHRLRVAFVSF